MQYLGAPRCSAFEAQFVTASDLARTVPIASEPAQPLLKDARRVGSKRSFTQYQETAVQSSAFPAHKTNGFPGISPARTCTTLRTASMDSAVSSTSPLPLTKRQCLHFHPGTPDVMLHSTTLQQPAQQQTAPSSLLTQAGLHAYQIMLQQQQQQSVQMSGVAAYLHQLQQVRQAAIHASSAHVTQQQQQQQQQPWCEQECSMPYQHQWLQYQQQQQLLQQQQCVGQHQVACTSATFSRQVANMPAKNQPGSQDSFDSFIHDLLDIQTPPQYAEQLRQQPTSKRTDATADKSALYRKALVAQLAFAPAQRQQQYQQERQRCLPCQSTVQQHPCSAQPSQASLHHLMSIAHTARQQVHQHVQKQTVLAKRQAMLQHCLKIKQHATAVASQQQQQQQAPRGGPSLGFPDLLLYWAKGLALQRSESVLLACHLWKKVQPQVSIAYMHLLGAERLWEAMLVGCLWVAAKLEECRRGVPSATKVGVLVSLDKAVMGSVELYLMQLVNWAPLRGWQISRA